MTGSDALNQLKFCIKQLYKFSLRSYYYVIMWLRGSKVDWTTQICSNTIINDCVIGKYGYIGPGSILNNAIVGNYCSFAPNVQIGGMEHSWWWGSTSVRISKYCKASNVTTIGDDVWIGANAVIRQGLSIGRGAVIGAGAVVLNDVAAYSMVAGVPAQVIRKRFPDNVIQAIKDTGFWQYPPRKAQELLEKIKYS